MTDIKLQGFGEGYWYLASPYSKYKDGLDAAFKEISRNAALLLKAKVSTYSPIAHSHTIAIHGDIDPLDHSIWLGFDRPMIDGAKGIIMCKMAGWEESYGMNYEREAFEAAGKPVVWMEPGHVPAELF